MIRPPSWRDFFPYIVPPIAFEPSTCTFEGINLDACPIRTLLEVLKCAMSCGITVQGLFFHYCDQLSWYSILNAEVITILPKYFLSSLLTRLYCLPRYLVLWCKWPAEEFSRSTRSSSSSDDGSLCFPSLDFYPHVWPR